jgi:hypothetical protein
MLGTIRDVLLIKQSRVVFYYAPLREEAAQRPLFTLWRNGATTLATTGQFFSMVS